MGDELLLSESGPATVITLNRPDVMNAISVGMWEKLGQVLDQLCDVPSPKPVVITGQGNRAFSAGSDLAEFSRMDTEEVNCAFIIMEETIARFERMPVPVIAAINGWALGSALELACSCDIVVAAETARLGMPVARLGIMLSPDFAKRIVALTGPTWTKYLLFTGRSLTAAQAQRIGLVNEVLPPDQLQPYVEGLTTEMWELSRHSLLAAKQSVYSSLPAPAPSPVDQVPPYFINESDFRAALRAFLNKPSRGGFAARERPSSTFRNRGESRG